MKSILLPFLAGALSVVAATGSAAGPYDLTFSTFFGGRDPGNPHNTAQNAYVCKLTPDDTSLVWGSFFGIDHLHRDLALDANDDVYVTWGVRPDANDRSHNGGVDWYVAKLLPDGSDIVYGTFLGGEGNDAGRSGCVDDAGNLIVAGSSSGGWPLKNAFQTERKGRADTVVARLSMRMDR